MPAETTLNGIRVFNEPGNVCVAIGNGKQALTCAMGSSAAIKIGAALMVEGNKLRRAEWEAQRASGENG